MIKNYLVIALRNFFKNRGYTLINILGLSLGLTSCIIIFLVIDYDLRFDKFHSRYDRIYRVVQDTKGPSGISYGSVTPYPLANAFRNDFPDVPMVTQLHYQGEAQLTVEDEKQRVEGILFADSLFFEVFDFEVLSGNPKVALGEPGKVFLTKSMADKILKNKETTRLKIDKVDLEVAGIIADPPPNSHINFTMVVSMASFTPDFIGGFPINHWGLTARGFTYVVLPELVTQQAIESKFTAFAKKYSPDDASRTVLKLQPLRDIHFDDQYFTNPGHNDNIDAREFVVMGILGTFILLIACINFINLATALSEKKSKEIGIRKTLGAQRGQLTLYFLSETFLLTLFAVLLSLGATEWLLTWLNPFLKKEIDLPLFSNYVLVLFLLFLVLATTLLAGFYPSLILSRFSPTSVFRRGFSVPGSSGALVRKSLVIFQFLIAHVLVIGTFIISDQMRYFRSKPLGFDENAVITISLPERKKAPLNALRARLEAIPGISGIAFGVGAPISDNGMYTGFFLTENGEEDGAHSVNFKAVDRHYLETYNIKLAAGRWFNENDEKNADLDLPKEERRAVYVVNEAAARKLGFLNAEDMVGKNITTGIRDIDAEVVGVLKDFHVSSLHKEIEPVVFAILPDYFYEGGIKLGTKNLKETIGQIETSWKEVFPDSFFEYEFLDEQLANLYERDEKTFTLFKIFAGVSIFIGCLGLYGLISFVANQKRKEVGIRKVMGATVSSILLLFSKEFIRLVIIAFVIASPLTWYLMNKWLQNFAYQVDISWYIFLVGFLAILFVVLATIAYRSVMAAKANPAVTLRSE
ncbi:MAG TPA: ABC transporter permease [Chryseolinea sp.]|nr:ABC transporter permease [Chryseolinea sp.]